MNQKIMNQESQTNKNAQRSGQVMLVTVVALSAMTLAATAISSILTLIQIRQAQGVADSAKAIYAADSGIEYELYKVFKDSSYPKPTFLNGADFTTSVDATTQSIKSAGQSRTAVRAFRVSY